VATQLILLFTLCSWGYLALHGMDMLSPHSFHKQRHRSKMGCESHLVWVLHPN